MDLKFYGSLECGAVYRHSQAGVREDFRRCQRAVIWGSHLQSWVSGSLTGLWGNVLEDLAVE